MGEQLTAEQVYKLANDFREKMCSGYLSLAQKDKAWEAFKKSMCSSPTTEEMQIMYDSMELEWEMRRAFEASAKKN